MSISLCCNVFNDAKALRGLLEASSGFFDNLFIVHSGVGGAYSTDGTIELAEQFGAKMVYDDIQKGFGYIRSRLIHECECDWAFILDADERFYPVIKHLHCEGSEEYPSVRHPNLKVTSNGSVVNQGAKLRDLIAKPEYKAIRSTRRHWMDFSWTKPSQNWLQNKDHQLRIVRNLPEVQYDYSVRMHERLVDVTTGGDPRFAEQDDYSGIFHDHFHCFFRFTNPGHKEFNEENYSKLERGELMAAPK